MNTLVHHPIERRRFLTLSAGAATVALAPRSLRWHREVRTIRVDEFVELSIVLTGLEDLEDDVGEIYLERLLADGQEGPLRRLLAAAGNEPSLRRIRRSGLLTDDAAVAALVETILTYWYTGVVDTPQGPEVVTWVEAGAWLALSHFAEPPTVDLGKEEWAERP